MEKAKTHKTKVYILMILVIYIIFCILVINSLHSRSFMKIVDSYESNGEVVRSKMENSELSVVSASSADNINDSYQSDLQVSASKLDLKLMGLIMDERELVEQQIGYREYLFNSLISDRIGHHARNIPDTREEICKKVKYDEEELMKRKVSIIITYYNELESTLMRTIYSILAHTSDEYLQEILLIDDGSTNNMNNKIIMNWRNMTELNKSKIKMEKLSNHSGVAKSRVYAANKATGDIIVFMDSHCEVNVGWLEPLMVEIIKNEQMVVSPLMDIINPDTFEYEESQLIRYGFDWKLNYVKELLSIHQTQNGIDAYATPVLPGNVVAQSRANFIRMGGYDVIMQGWSGESFEFSWRTWLCGGKLAIAPCSRVAHVERSTRPYGGSRESLVVDQHAQVNKMRGGHLWLEKYRHFVRWQQPRLYQKMGNLSEMFKLRQKLKCKSFSWYLDEIYPELEIPRSRISHVRKLETNVDNSKTLSLGNIQLSNIYICLMADSTSSIVFAQPCNTTTTSQQTWWYTSNHNIRFENNLCLNGIARLNASPSLVKCDPQNVMQKWIFIDQHQQKESQTQEGFLYNLASGLCLAVNISTKDEQKYQVLLRLCKNPTIQTFYFATT